MFKNAINCLRVLGLQNKTCNIVNSLLKYTCTHTHIMYMLKEKKKDLKDKHQNMNQCYLSG